MRTWNCTIITGLAAAVAVLAGVGSATAAQRWGPTWSEVTGTLWSRTTLNREAATIRKVDGRSETRRIVKAEPGRHELVVASPMRKGFGGPDAHVPIELEACKRYYINAQFKAGIGTDWEPVLVYVEPIAGCKIPAQ